MFYAGYFTWVGYRPELITSPTPGGTFNCFVEADSVEEAGDKLKALITDLKGWSLAFEDVAHVHFDDLIEVKKLPPQGVLARFEEVDERGTLSTVLPGVDSEFCQPYSLRQESDDEDEDEMDQEPFISFEDVPDEPPPGPFH